MTKRNNTDQKTIIFFNGFYLPHLGGVERYTSGLINELKRFYKVVIVTSNVPQQSKNHEIIDDIEIYRLPTYKPLQDRFPILKRNSEYHKLIKEIQKIPASHIICNTRYYQINVLGAKIAKKHNIDLLAIDHSSSHITIGNRIIDKFIAIYDERITKKIKKMSPRFYGVSKKCNEWLKHYDIKASGVFYNAVVGQSIKRIKTNKIRIGYAGRIIPEKGVENLIQAYNRVKNKNTELVIIGDGPQLNYLKKQYKGIKFTGALDHAKILAELSKIDIFVYPSMYPEGFPTAILEAGLAGCAIIATDRGGTRELISDQKLGIIVDENVEDLAKKLSKLVSDPKMVQNYQKNIQRKVKAEFTWGQVAKVVIKELQKYE